jgi:hypothetical protein
MNLGNRPTDMASRAIRVVEYTMKLELPAAKWQRVEWSIEAAIEAAASGDLEKLRWAMDDLALASPVRVIRPDGSQVTRVDQKVFERANVLIHSLQSMQPAAGGEAADEGRDEGNGGR